MQYEVFYTVSYRAIVNCDEDGNMVQDPSEVDIPEGGENDSEYVPDSFVLNGYSKIKGVQHDI